MGCPLCHELAFSDEWLTPKETQSNPRQIYNHTTSNLAIFSQETSQDKLPEAYNRQSIIVIQVHDKLHEKLFISTYSFL